MLKPYLAAAFLFGSGLTYGATQVQTCLDVPPVAAGAGLGSCVKSGCGPTYNTDRVRVQGADGLSQLWQPWSATTGATKVVSCEAGRITSVWVARSTITADPGAAPSGSGTPNSTTPPAGNTVHLSWTAPTTNTDKSALTDLASFTVYQGTSAEALVPVITGSTKLTALTFVTPPLMPGTYFFAVTAVNAKGAESVKSSVVSLTLVPPAPAASTPGAPSKLTITVVVTAASIP